MVFEALVIDILNKFLNQYIENLDSSQLKIGIWGGDVVLADLIIKQSIFSDLNLPFKVAYGKLGKLSLRIPWKNLYGESTAALVENLFILFIPNSETKYDPVLEEKWKQDRKQRQLKLVEEAKKRELEKGQKPVQRDTFVEKLAMQIIKTIQIEVKNIHIRYEDKTTDPDSPFSIGTTISNISLKSTLTDPFPLEFKNWKTQELIYKIIQLEGLSIYWNPGTELLVNRSHSELVKILLETIPKPNYKPEGFKYVFGPLGAKGSLRLNPKPEIDGTNYAIPKVLLLVDMEEIRLGVSRKQYRSMALFLDNLHRLSNASRYRKYKPLGVSVLGNAKIWWKFAYDAVTEDIKRRKLDWSWEHIRKHREICRRYSELYHMKLTNKKHNRPLEKELMELEKILTAFDITLLREQVYVEVERTALAESESKANLGWFGYFSSYLGPNKAEADKDDFVSKIEKVMTPKEKEKLYKAMDYQENYIRAIYPDYYVEFKFLFKLKALRLRVYEDKEEKSRSITVLSLSLREVHMVCDQRPSVQAIKLLVTLGDFTVLGKSLPGEEPPTMIKSNYKKFDKLVDVLFETNPLDKFCDVRIHLKANGLFIIYHAETVNLLRDIFHTDREENASTYKIVSATAASLPTFQEITSMGLQYAIDKSSKLELRIHVLASNLVVPYGGVFEPDQEFLIMKLGQFSVITQERPSRDITVRQLHLQGSSEKDIFDTFVSASYRKFKCQLEGVQILHRLPGEEWTDVLENLKPSPLRLLEPTNLTIVIQKCLITDDARIPKVIIEGELPSINLNISENRFISLVGLGLSIPTSIAETEAIINKRMSSSAWSLQSFGTQFETKLRHKTKRDLIVAREDYVQGIDLVVRFKMNQFVVSVSKVTRSKVTMEPQKDSTSLPAEKFLTLSMINLESELTCKTFETLAEVKLGDIKIIQKYGKQVIPLIGIKGMMEDDYLFLVQYENVDKKIPDFFTKRGGVVSRIVLDITALEIRLHKEAILDHIAFLTLLQNRLEEAKAAKSSRMNDTTTKRMISILEEGVDVSMSDKKIVAKGKKFRKKKTGEEVVDMILEVDMDSLNIKLSSDARAVSELSVLGGKVQLSTQKSFMNVDCRLNEIRVLDLSPNTLHSKIVNSVGSQTLSLKATIYNKEYLEKSKSVDLLVDAEIGRIRCVFLNCFIKTAVDFMNTFHNETSMLREGATAAAQKAKEEVLKAYENETKISLNIRITAPLIVFPRKSTSSEVLMMDMGILTIKSFITELDSIPSGDSNETNTPLMDIIRCHLENVKLMRAYLDGEHVVPDSEISILKPVTLDVTLHRNLSISWYKDMVHLQIQGRLELVHVTLSHTDLCFIVYSLQENFQEGEVLVRDKIDVPGIEEGSKTSFPVKAHKDITDHDDIEGRNQPAIVFTFLTDRFIVDNINDSKYLDPRDIQSYKLARFVLEVISVKSTLFTDGSLSTSAFLSNISLEDTRPGKEGRITNLIQRKEEEMKNVGGSTPAMLNVNFQRKALDSFVDIRVYGFNLILSMDFISRLITFFTIDDIETSPPPIQIQTKQTEVKYTAPVTKPGRSGSHSKKVKEKKETFSRNENSTFTVNIKIEKPDIVIVEHMDSPDTDALIFKTEVVMKYRSAGTRQVVSGTVSDIGLVSCCFNPQKRSQTLSQIIKPFTISMAGSTPEDQGLHLDICLTDIYVAINAKAVELINKCHSTLVSDITRKESIEEVADYSNLWDVMEFEDDDYWFLQADKGVDALLTLPKNPSIRSGSFKVLEEICLISIPSVVVTIEDVTVKSKMPLILLEMSSQAQVHNWSSQLTIESLIKLQMQYFNKSLSAWEPLIEPSEVIRDKKSFFVPWELDCSVVFAAADALDVGSTGSADEEFIPPPSPKLTVTLSCTENLEITITKSCIEVLTNLVDAFTTAVSQTTQLKHFSYPPYVVQNHTGVTMDLLLVKSNLYLYKRKKEGYKVVRLESGCDVELEESRKTRQKTSISVKKVFVGEKKELYLHLKCSLFEKGVLEVPISRTTKRYYPITNPTNVPGNWGLVTEVNISHETEVVTLRTLVQLKNHFNEAIDVHYMTNKGDELEYVGTIEGNSVFNVPFHAVYSASKELFFSVKGYTVCINPLNWKLIQNELNTSVLLRCNPKYPEDMDPFFIKAIGEVEQIYFENTYRYTVNSFCVNIHLQPTMELLNCLPIDLVVFCQGSTKEKNLSIGERFQITHAEPGVSTITLRISDYLEKEWSCKQVIPANPSEFAVWTFTSYSGLAPEVINVGIFHSTRRTSAIFTIYSPYLVVNQTGHMLSYKFDDNISVLFHPPTYRKPMMFSPGVKKFFSKKKVSMKVNQGEWSDKFPVDVAGSGGTIECYDTDRHSRYLIAVTITLTFNSLSKIVLFTPYYTIFNKTIYCLECQESDLDDQPWITLEAGECIPFWPVSEEEQKTIRLRLCNSTEVTSPFCYDSTDSLLLRLNNKCGGLYVDIQTTNAGTSIVIYPYEPGLAPALILNHTNEVLNFSEKGIPNVVSLKPREMCLYTWIAPTEERKLECISEHQKECSFNLREDVEGKLESLGRTQIRYVSFLNGIQRILLFTEDISAASDAKLAGYFENTGTEAIFKIHGIGVSLVDNINQVEILYIGFVSSGVVWEARKESRSRFKALSPKEIQSIEMAYKRYQESNDLDDAVDSVVVIDNKIQVNFETMEILYPSKKILRRMGEPGLWASYRSSAGYITIHLKINKIQIDNQLHDSIFPVVLCPVPPPKTVAISQGPKPFLELSVLKVAAGHSRVQQYKYFKILVQEFSVNLDMGLIVQIWQFLSKDDLADEVYKAKLKKDFLYCEEPLAAHITVLSSGEQRNFYDLLHFSPLKIHVSFSLAGNIESDLVPPALSVLLQSLGVTLTDLTDVLFRLSYFERKSAFLSYHQLESEVIRHYYGQAIRQAYVLLLGLDVIGNPFGLVIGIGQGVEAFFYEPVQGIIQGPSDFAAGVALGCKSLFGHTVGGTAGTLGRITGTLGKGLAVLSLDKEYQRQRMEQNKQQNTISTSMAQSGKGVVMGILEGVAGVITKPLVGAREEGLGGFIKGMGKGVAGFVTRPVTGVVDFASTSLNAVKRATELNYDYKKLRSPRFFQDDKLVMPYKKQEATGNTILNEVEKRKYYKTDKYEYHAELRGGEVLLLTDKRLIVAEYSDVFGNWHVNLEITWLDMSAPPKEHIKGVAVSLPRKRTGLMYSRKDVKILPVDEPYLKDILVKKMVELYYLETKNGT